ncbi:hypothetical protein HW555_014251, partial [Spodoptera exigua]
GRATFLPVTTIKPRTVSTAVRERVNNVPGFLGIASELVQFPNEISNVIQNLLGVTLLAESLESANQLAKVVNYQYRVVSLEGDVMNSGGSMTGGANKRGNQGSLFSQTQELQTLTEQMERVEKQLTLTEKEVQQLTDEVKHLNEKLEQLRSTGETSRLKQLELQNKQANQAETITRLTKEQRLFEFEARELHQFLTEYQTRKEELTVQQQELNQTKDRLDQEMKQVDQEASQMETLRAEAFERYNQIQADQAVAAEQLAHLTGQVAEKQTQLDECLARETALRQQLQQLNDNSTDHQVTEESLAVQLEQLSDKKEQLQTSIQEAKTARHQLQEQVDQIDTGLAEENKQQQHLLTEQTQIEVEKNRAEIKLDNSLQYLQEEYSLTFERANEDYQLTMDKEQAKVEVKRLKREIERLGPVNLNAIEQYEQVNERHEFLVSQRDDLLDAKDQLFETMGEMDEEVKARFSEVFEAIRAQFKVVFPNMFGGGRAELILTNPEDLLNTGVEIEAQPPGKKLQNLSLLSGGERALTAIALLFSIIRVRPVPFCVLDEVEAALDDANVSRFGHYLSEFEDETQFIVVTHRKGTMEASDVLYGVTMQESGVSKIVSVRLEDKRGIGLIKLVAIDLDGTLLNSHKEISPKNKDVLAQAKAAGVKIVLCTAAEVHHLTADQIYNKAVVAIDENYLDEQISKIPATFYDRYEIIKTRSNLLEFMPKGITKAYGISLLARDLGIKQEEIMTIGDEENDLPMIEYAGLGVAMENAVASVKDLADVITDTNDNDGVAHAVEKFVLEPLRGGN